MTLELINSYNGEFLQQNAVVKLAAMERQISIQAKKLEQLEILLEEERLSKASLQMDFEHALDQIYT